MDNLQATGLTLIILVLAFSIASAAKFFTSQEKKFRFYVPDSLLTMGNLLPKPTYTPIPFKPLNIQCSYCTRKNKIEQQNCDGCGAPLADQS